MGATTKIVFSIGCTCRKLQKGVSVCTEHKDIDCDQR